MLTENSQCSMVVLYSTRPLCNNNLMYDQLLFYTKAFDYNSVSICLNMIKLSHHTAQGPYIYCVKFRGWMRRTF